MIRGLINFYLVVALADGISQSLLTKRCCACHHMGVISIHPVNCLGVCSFTNPSACIQVAPHSEAAGTCAWTWDSLLADHGLESDDIDFQALRGGPVDKHGYVDLRGVLDGPKKVDISGSDGSSGNPSMSDTIDASQVDIVGSDDSYGGHSKPDIIDTSQVYISGSDGSAGNPSMSDAIDASQDSYVDQAKDPHEVDYLRGYAYGGQIWDLDESPKERRERLKAACLGEKDADEKKVKKEKLKKAWVACNRARKAMKKLAEHESQAMETLAMHESEEHFKAASSAIEQAEKMVKRLDTNPLFVEPPLFKWMKHQFEDLAFKALERAQHAGRAFSEAGVDKKNEAFEAFRQALDAAYFAIWEAKFDLLLQDRTGMMNDAMETLVKCTGLAKDEKVDYEKVGKAWDTCNKDMETLASKKSTKPFGDFSWYIQKAKNTALHMRKEMYETLAMEALERAEHAGQASYEAGDDTKVEALKEAATKALEEGRKIPDMNKTFLKKLEELLKKLVHWNDTINNQGRASSRT